MQPLDNQFVDCFDGTEAFLKVPGFSCGLLGHLLLALFCLLAIMVSVGAFLSFIGPIPSIFSQFVKQIGYCFNRCVFGSFTKYDGKIQLWWTCNYSKYLGTLRSLLCVLFY